MRAPVVHVELRGLDSEGLRTFYRDVFDWEPDPSLSIGDYAVHQLADTTLTAATGPVPEWSTQSCTFFIQVDDIDATLARVEQAGGHAVMPKQESPPDFPAKHLRVFTKFVDPAGNVVGLVERPP